ncbi:hypothetical protein BDV26DRAFT_184015 [Aspergillus bertholletiae]|uniref:N-acetyltransferase domain-containing protein n=1 Tax=Aspergillus bertholletiae TaxID=1226010 RepID=A0A5N7BAA5_9EURO|nr:hypothetical protein BDV26DRAFT_184015 [Aspergillus bertholletiae]
MSGPISLAPRFEIRQLGPEHQDWANAIVMHSNIFCSPVWPNIYPADKTKRLYQGFFASEYLIAYQIASGLSYGVFDKEYKYKFPSSEPTGGKLHWDWNDEAATNEQLIKQMDFPLVSVAMSYDGSNPIDLDRLKPLFEVIPLLAKSLQRLDETDSRGEVTTHEGTLMRNGTSTKADYEGHGLMKRAAHWLMHESVSKGFKGIEIPCFHDAVIGVWSNPPAPFRGEIVAQLNIKDQEEIDGDGKEVKPYAHVDQQVAKIYVTLG